MAPAAPTEIAKIDPKLPTPHIKTPATPDSKKPPAPAAEPDKPVPEDIEPAKLPERVGHLVSSDDQVLLAYNQKAGYWERVAAKESLVSQQRLLVPPTYRDEISIGAGVTVDLLGGTQVQLLPGTDKEPVGLAIDFGRLVLVPSQEALKVRLAVGGHSGLLTMADNETIAALEVTRSALPGADPETGASHATADLYVTHGEVRWQEQGMAEPVRIIAPARLTLDEQSPHDLQSLQTRDLPKWIVLESLGVLEQRASAAVAQSLQGGRSAGLGLMELAYHRQKEVAWLARRIAGLYRPVRAPGCRPGQSRLQGRLAEICRAASPGHRPWAGVRRHRSPGHGKSSTARKSRRSCSACCGAIPTNNCKTAPMPSW